MRELARWLYFNKRSMVLVFEGWDAAGKGGSIRRLTEKVDPRGFEVFPIAPGRNLEGESARVRATRYDATGRRLDRQSDSQPFASGQVRFRLPVFEAVQPGEWIGVEFRLSRRLRKLREFSCLQFRARLRGPV